MVHVGVKAPGTPTNIIFKLLNNLEALIFSGEPLLILKKFTFGKQSPFLISFKLYPLKIIYNYRLT